MKKLLIFVLFIISSSTLFAQKVLCDYTITNACQNDTVWFQDKSTATGGAVLAPIHIFFGDKDITGVQIDAYIQPGGKIFHIYNKPGVYTVNAIAKSIPVAGVFDQNSTNKSLQIFAQPALELQYPEGKLIYTGQSKPIWAVGDFENDKVVWSNKFVGKTLLVNKPGRYSVIVTDNHACKNWARSDSMIIKDTVGIGYEIEVVNNVLTPNGDGFDDFLIVANIETYANPVIIQIFNIWGQKVYEVSDYRESYLKGEYWKAETVEAGTYYYTIRSKTKKGKTGYIDVVK